MTTTRRNKQSPDRNTLRRIAARTALNPYINEDPHAEMSQHVIDLLANLMHFCNGNNIQFADCVRIAENHFEEEKGGAE